MSTLFDAPSAGDSTKKRLKPSTLRIIILAGSVLLMAALFILLSIDTSSCGKKDDETVLGFGHTPVTSDSTPEAEYLIDRLGTELESIDLVNVNGEYHICRREGSDELTIESLSDLPLDTDFIEYVWNGSITLGYLLSIKTDDYAQYGLIDPQAVVRCNFFDGTTERFVIGDSVPGSSNNFYYCIDSQPGWVFSTEFMTSFFQGDSYWLSDDIFRLDGAGYGAEIGNINLWGTSFEQTLTLEPHQTEDKSDPWYDCDYIITSPGIYPTDSYNISVLRDELSSITADEAMVAHPTDAQLAEYGLDRPYAVIKHQRNGVWHTIRLARASYDIIYAKADGVEVIYRLIADNYPMLSSLETDVIRSADVHIRRFAAMENMTFSFDGETYAFRLERSDLGNDLYSYRLFCNDVEIDQVKYKSMLESFNAATAVSYDSGEYEDAPAMTVTISYFDSFGRSDETILYTPAGNRRYVCTINGSGNSVVTQMWLDQIKAAVRSLPDAAV